MSGRVDELRLEEVLQVVGSSPQCTAVELFDEDGAVRGRIWIQSGRVLGAERGSERGRSAFFGLFSPHDGDRFVVQRVLAAPPTDPLGSVSALVLQALERTRELAEGSNTNNLRRMTTQEPVWEEATTARPARVTNAVVAIASVRGGVGRSTITAQLGAALARSGRQMIRVDAENSGDAAILAGVRPQVARPVDELLDGADAVDEAMIDTQHLRLRYLAVAAPPAGRHSVAAEWKALLTRVRARADIVLVDAPAGIAGLAADVIGAAGHVLGVVRSDRNAPSAAVRLESHIDSFSGRGPSLLGIVVNLFDGRSPPSVEAFHKIAACGVSLFETSVPRADAIATDANHDTSPITFLFDQLAGEVSARIRVAAGISPPLR